MEDCVRMQEMISRMLDGDLDAGEQAALAKHLEDCEDCRRLYAAFSAVSGALRDGLEEAPESLRENVMARIRREKLTVRSRRPRRWAFAAAAVLALALGLRFAPALQTAELPMKTAAQDFAAAEKNAAAEEESAVLYEAAQESADAAVPRLAAGYAAASGSAAVIELPDLSLAALLEKLADGAGETLSPDRAGPFGSVTVVCADASLTLREYEDGWYYEAPDDPTPRLSRLTPDALRALAD